MILFCTILKKGTKDVRYSSKILSSRNKSSLTTYLQDANLLDLNVGQLEGLALRPVWDYSGHNCRFHTCCSHHFATYRDASGLGFKSSEAQSTQDFPIGSTSGLRLELGLLMLFSASFHVSIFLPPQYRKFVRKFSENSSENSS